MYEETNPDWAPSLNLGYVAALPNESRFALDVMPTILKALGAEAPAQCDRESLVLFLGSDSPGNWHREAHFELDFHYVLDEPGSETLNLTPDQCALCALRGERYKERNSRKRPNESFFDELNDEGNGIACQHDITTTTFETAEAACQTDKDLGELRVVQKRELNELKVENSKLTKELADLKSGNENNFTKEFLKKEENRSTLKF